MNVKHRKAVLPKSPAYLTNMKLILCPECHDVFKLDYKPRECKCGACKGHYYEDGLTAEYSGPAIPLGFANSSLADAIKKQPKRGQGKEFIAFVIPKSCPTFRKKP